MAKFIKIVFFFHYQDNHHSHVSLFRYVFGPEPKSEYKRGIISLHEVPHQNNAGINCNVTIPQQQLYPLLPTV